MRGFGGDESVEECYNNRGTRDGGSAQRRVECERRLAGSHRVRVETGYSPLPPPPCHWGARLGVLSLVNEKSLSR
ncbi:hypothetical protein ACI65C_009010 [Semiaphis heraclei]